MMNILITGAAGNLGDVVVQHLTQEGHRAFGTIRPGGKVPQTSAEYLEADLTSESSVANLFQNLKLKTDRLHAVVCLAGGFDFSGILDSSQAKMMHMLEMNYMTAFLTAAEASRWMNTTGGGQLIFIGAKPALEGHGAAILPYTISKSAVIQLASTINQDKFLQNIRAAVIAPSTIDTPTNRASMPDANFDNWVKPEVIAAHISFVLSEPAQSLSNPILKVYNKS